MSASGRVHWTVLFDGFFYCDDELLGEDPDLGHSCDFYDAIKYCNQGKPRRGILCGRKDGNDCEVEDVASGCAFSEETVAQ